MARRRTREEPENHERWLVSYADFITLLFALFVVMYSISSLNEGKYKILSDSLVGVFNQVDRAVKPIPIGEQTPRITQPDAFQIDAPQSSQQPIDPLQSIMQSMQAAFADLIDSKQLTIRGNELWVEIELNSSLLFPSGDALPNDHAFDLLEKIAGILAPFDNPIHVEGFTDNLPINTETFPTNWELSAARAGSVVRMLAADGVDPARLAAVGYGEFQPIADNSTAEGRARNRRVILVVSRNLEVRRSVSGVGSGNARPVGAAPQPGTQRAVSSDR
ncbi:flagellar motor protein MotD [Stutzerimonas stutzeri]|uniref:flagellar motor protein MotD n=1 Tax=Stutzerimonas stutzeri TaxID=316 RepID=UPI00210A9B97|nr:flagellar motor protein MotD [Stutzerimonas stutzeri]MCQ4320943.1 flagellar motor protein MotD [Stutzerimonas stutzeri]